MRKRAVFVLGLIAVLSLTFAPAQQADVSEADETQQLPNIDSCTSGQLASITLVLQEMVVWMDELSVITTTGNPDAVLSVALEMEAYWYEESPDIPYCAQGVHSRLLIDRVVANYTLTAYALANWDTDQADIFLDRLDASITDLGIYADILSTY
jgi:hypothetical protein